MKGTDGLLMTVVPACPDGLNGQERQAVALAIIWFGFGGVRGAFFTDVTLTFPLLPVTVYDGVNIGQSISEHGRFFCEVSAVTV